MTTATQLPIIIGATYRRADEPTVTARITKSRQVPVFGRPDLPEQTILTWRRTDAAGIEAWGEGHNMADCNADWFLSVFTIIEREPLRTFLPGSVVSDILYSPLDPDEPDTELEALAARLGQKGADTKGTYLTVKTEREAVIIRGVAEWIIERFDMNVERGTSTLSQLELGEKSTYRAAKRVMRELDRWLRY